MILDGRAVKVIAVWMVLAGVCPASEYAVLSTGFRIHADRHETEGSVVRLFDNGGVTEFPAAQIARFEADEEKPRPVAPPAPVAAPLPTLRELVTAAAERNGLPPEFVHSVVAAESGYRIDAVSRKGAIGPMQLMPATAREYGADPTKAEQTVEAGTRYLRIPTGAMGDTRAQNNDQQQ